MYSCIPKYSYFIKYSYLGVLNYSRFTYGVFSLLTFVHAPLFALKSQNTIHNTKTNDIATTMAAAAAHTEPFPWRYGPDITPIERKSFIVHMVIVMYF